MKTTDNNEINLKLFLDIDLTKPTIDPCKIDTLSKAIASDNLNARLILNDNGNYKPWLAKSFTVEENKINLYFGEAKTSKGIPVTASDAKSSLERLVILNTNTHAKLQLFINCADIALGKSCNNIKVVSDNHLELILKKSKYAHNVIKILSSTEYGIVPQSALRDNKITDYTDTTGAFYLAGNVLKKNKYFISENDYPDNITIVTNMRAKKPVDMFIDGDVDILSTSSSIPERNFNLISNAKNNNIFKTEKIKLFNVSFGPGGLSKLTAKERITVINKMRDNLFKNFPVPNDSVKTFEFLPDAIFKQSSLVPSQDYQDPISKKIDFISYTGMEKSMISLKEIQEIDVKFSETFPPEVEYDKRPDSYFAASDVAFDADFTLFSYFLNSKIIYMQDKEKDDFLEMLIENEDTADRIAQINSFHTKVIAEGLIGPLFIAPYTILTKAPYRSIQSKLSASTKLWMIVKE